VRQVCGRPSCPAPKLGKSVGGAPTTEEAEASRWGEFPTLLSGLRAPFLSFLKLGQVLNTAPGSAAAGGSETGVTGKLKAASPSWFAALGVSGDVLPGTNLFEVCFLEILGGDVHPSQRRTRRKIRSS